jgi:hypothetical protein
MTESQSQGLTEVKQLQELTLVSPDKAVWPYIGQLRTLQKLRVEDTDMTDKDLQHFYKMSDLKVLTWYSGDKPPRFTAKGIAALHGALPKCQLQISPMQAELDRIENKEGND